jgi:hypothetical protein
MHRIAVLACGRIGAMHAANIAAHPRARLAAVQDINRAAAGDQHRINIPRRKDGGCRFHHRRISRC